MLHKLSMTTLAALSTLLLLGRADNLGRATGLNKVWSHDFCGAAGRGADTNEWRYVTEISVNNEVQKYTESCRNVQLSGGCTLQLVPLWEGDRWTSGRLEGIRAFTTADRGVTLIEARIRFGKNDPSRKQGIWPAFWLLGESIRHGVDWPMCGEIDIMETVNGEPLGYGTVHCEGGCGTPQGIGNSTPFSDGDWHVWSVQIDRRELDWRKQSIIWLKDDVEFHQVRGARIGKEDVWASLAHSPMNIILNVAVGGNWVSFREESSAPSHQLVLTRPPARPPE
jgi:beta-glucanase (GH16 family)